MSTNVDAHRKRVKKRRSRRRAAAATVAELRRASEQLPSASTGSTTGSTSSSSSSSSGDVDGDVATATATTASDEHALPAADASALSDPLPRVRAVPPRATDAH